MKVHPLLWSLAAASFAACATPTPARPTGDEPMLSRALTRAPASAPAQDPAAIGGRRALVGIGFTDSPDTTLFGGEVDFYTDDRLAFGPLLQLGVDDDYTIFAPSMQAKYTFPLERTAGAPLFVPFVQGGAGFAYIRNDRIVGDDDDLGFMLHMGGGIEVRFGENYSLASTLMVDILPNDVLGEHSFWSWQVVQFGFRF